MGGQFGIGGGFEPKRLGAYTPEQREQLKQMGLEYQAFNRDMSIMAQMLKQQQMQQMMRAYYAGNGGGGGGSASGIGDTIKSFVETGIGVFNNVKSKKSESTQQTPQTPQTSSPQRTSSPQVSPGASAPSGLAQGVNTSSMSYDTSFLDSISSKLENPNLSAGDLTTLQTALSATKADLTTKLAEAQVNLSNLQGQQETAKESVTQLNGEVATAETAKTNAQKDLTDKQSQLNQSTKDRDKLDAQLSSVNADYKDKCTAVKNCESEKTAAQQGVSSAQTSVAQAESGLAVAEQQLSSALSTLSSTPQTINGQPNPAYTAAKSAAQKAQTQRDNAEGDLTTAKEELDEANSRLNTAEENLTKAQDAKNEILKTLQETDSKYKDMAKLCANMQKGVEQSQKNYDTSLETFDTANANYEKLNTELQAQNGILNQLKICQTNVETLQSASTRVGELEASLNEKLQNAPAAQGAESRDFESVKNDLLENAAKSEGCGANKTILENLIAAKDYDLSKCTGELWGTHLNSTYGSAAEFEAQGYMKNADGSFTDPRTGVTMINVLGDDKTWVSQAGLSGAGETGIYGSKATAGRDYPGLFDAIDRNQQQMDARISFDGFDESGNPVIKRSKTRLDLG